jgi:hypothetical protein
VPCAGFRDFALRRKTKDDSDLSVILPSLLLPVGRLMLENGLGIGDLIQAAKQAYVRAAIAQVVPTGERINASRLSVMTGLTRKEVSTIMSELRGAKNSRRVDIKEQRAVRVLRGWRIDPRFGNGRGQPARLSLRGERNSFSALVRLYGGDVTPNSVLKELERMKIVALDRSGGLRLRSVRVNGKSTQNLTDLARLLPDFANTVSQQNGPTAQPLFFGFRDLLVDSPDQAARFQRTFSNRSAAVLQGVEQWIVSQSQSPERKTTPTSGKLRVGIGVYLVQGNSESGVEAALKPQELNHRKVVRA